MLATTRVSGSSVRKNCSGRGYELPRRIHIAHVHMREWQEKESRRSRGFSSVSSLIEKFFNQNKMPGGRPKGSSRCSECAKKRLKCTHSSDSGSLKRKADEISLEESVSFLKKTPACYVEPRKHWRKRKHQRNKTENQVSKNFNRNPLGMNQFSQKKKLAQLLLSKHHHPQLQHSTSKLGNTI